MTKDAQLKQNRLQGKVISTRDVIFDEKTFFEKKDLPSDKELIDHTHELVARVNIELPQAKNEEVLEEDGEILYSDRANLGIRRA